MTAAPWPVEIRLARDRASINVSFDTGSSAALPAEYLRVKSPSAEVRGHGPDEAITVSGKRRVRISGVEPVGNYAIRLTFDDGHSTGIYTWAYLDELIRGREHLWSVYIAELAAKGLTRGA